MLFRHGVDSLFSVDDLFNAFRLALDEPTARRLVYEWLDTFGFYVERDQIMEPCGGWEAYGLPGSQRRNIHSDTDDAPAEMFLRAQPAGSVADIVPQRVRAMFVRYTNLHHTLVLLAHPAIRDRFEAAGLRHANLPESEHEKVKFLADLRSTL